MTISTHQQLLAPDPVALPRIAVFGLGYVGAVSAACFCARGHDVIGVDVNPTKVAAVSAGHSPVVEERIGELIETGIAGGRLRATVDAGAAVAAADVILLCVGTPSAASGGPSFSYLERVAEEVGEALAASARGRTTRPTVVVRSTVTPGTCEDIVIPRIEKAGGLVAGRDFGVAVNPEFLREGTSVADFFSPPKTVIGQLDDASGDVVVALYQGLPGPVHRLPLRVAEISKYVDNAFHALKVGFANEMGALCAAMGLDSHEVMDVFVADRKLNISPSYLRPGFAFGGSCLPKDIRALTYAARNADVEMPLIGRILESNDAQIRRAVDAILASRKRRIGIIGLSFKPGTDDLRESPMVTLVETLIGKGLDVKILDHNVSVAKLTGANRRYIEEEIPHVSSLMCSEAADLLNHAELLVVGNPGEETDAALAAADPFLDVIDLTRGIARRPAIQSTQVDESCQPISQDQSLASFSLPASPGHS